MEARPLDVGSAASKRKLSRRLLRAAVGILVVLVVCEILLRLIFGFGSPVLYQADADCGYMPRPDQDVHRFFSHNYINHWGMRCGEIQPEPAAGTQRFFFIGDSVTYATSYVDQDKIWTSLLGRSLPAVAHQPVEILNMSGGGWAPGNEWGYLRSRGTFHSNVVFIVMTSGDLGGDFTPLAWGSELSASAAMECDWRTVDPVPVAATDANRHR